jgi:nucleoside-diphosphate-sugar epimerase
MKVLVTGSEGFIGSHLCRQLQDPFRFDLKIGFDLGNFDQVAETFESFKPEVVIHLGGNAYVGYAKENPDKDVTTNVIGTLNVLKASVDIKPKIIFTSTAQVYGTYTDKVIEESFQENPAHPYAISKLSAEHYCRWFSQNFGLNVCVLRFSNVYGFGRNSDVFADFIKMAREDHVIRIKGNPYNAPDFVNVNDVVRAIIHIKDAPLKGFEVYNVCYGESVTILSIAEKIADFFGAKVEYNPKSSSLDSKTFHLSNEKICKALGWKPEVSLAEGLRKMLERAKALNP